MNPRTRARRASLLAAAVLAGAAGGCSDGEAAAGGLVVSKVPRAQAAPGAAADGAAVVRHVGAELLPILARAAGDQNVAFSPASITMALGMTRAGARGESARQLDGLLGAPADEVHVGLNALDQVLASRSGARENEQGAEAEITLTTANSLWAQQGAGWEAPFLDTLKGRYGVGVHTVDYVTDADGARRAVNTWVADQTRDHITDLIGEGVFDDATRLTLVNALYLAAPWNKAFDTAKAITFHTAAGPDVSTPAMFSSRGRGYRSGDGWQAVTIPYAGEELAMTLIVPDAGRLAEVEDALDGERLGSLLEPAEVVPLHLTMPRFDLASRPDLTAALKAAGVTEPFVTEHDFDPMSRDPQVRPLRLAAALHQATVTVDEKGTVASAATAMVFEATGAPLDPVTLVVDRPFLFVIHDVETATPLFIGRVTDPTQK